MPGNIIKINDSLSWYVGDSKMVELVKWLNSNGYREEPPKGKAEKVEAKEVI